MTRYENDSYLEAHDFPFHIDQFSFHKIKSVEQHSHEFIEFVYVAEGSGQHFYAGTEYRIQEGDVFVIEPDVEHAYVVEDDGHLVVYNILFAPAILSHELQSLSKVTSFVDFFYVEPFLRQSVHFQSHLKLNPHQRIEMKQLLDRILSEYKDKNLGYRLLVKTRLIEMFVFLSRCYDQMLHKPMTAQASEHKIIERVAEFIELHHANPLSLAQVSQMCGMSQSAFTSKFKQFMGKTFIEFRNEIRIRMAKELMLSTNSNILQIAQEVGFDDLSFFNKLFKQMTGISPGQFRKSRKNAQE